MILRMLSIRPGSEPVAHPAGLCLFVLIAAVSGLCVPQHAAARDAQTVVASVHSDHTVLTRGVLTSRKVYPLGRLDYRVVARMLDRAAMIATGNTRIAEAWGDVVSGADRVGILYDAQSPAASLVLLDVVVDRIVRAGVRPANIVIWSDSERSLFSAGISLRSDAGSVRVVGADSAGFRDGVTRVVLDDCDVLINVARLRPDARVGMRGAVTNQLSSLPSVDRVAALQNPENLAAGPSKPVIRLKFKLHILDAFQPNYEFGPVDMPPYWDCGRLLASRDPVALDCAGLALLQAKRDEVKGASWPLDPQPAYLQTADTEFRLGHSVPEEYVVVTSEVNGS